MKKTYFGKDDMITVLVEERATGFVNPYVKIRWADPPVAATIEEAQAFTNAMIEALCFATSERKRLGLEIETATI